LGLGAVVGLVIDVLDDAADLLGLVFDRRRWQVPEFQRRHGGGQGAHERRFAVDPRGAHDFELR
jgi:hypothetical protein